MALEVQDLLPGHTYKIPVRIQESWDRWGYVTVEIPAEYDPEFITEILDEYVTEGAWDEGITKGGSEIDVDDTEEIEQLDSLSAITHAAALADGSWRDPDDFCRNCHAAGLRRRHAKCHPA